MSKNFIEVSKFLFDILKKDENVYLLIVDGLYSYMFNYCAFSLNEKERKRVINVGISEQNAISFASGLAMSGKKVYVVMFAAFLSSRAHEQVKLDICYNCANVTLIGNNAGFSGISHNGYSHCALEDISAFCPLPNLEIMTPSNNKREIDEILKYSYNSKKPLYIRLNNSFATHNNLDYEVKIKKNKETVKNYQRTGYRTHYSRKYKHFILFN